MTRIIALDVVLLGFLAMTVHAVAAHGYLGFFEAMFANPATRLAMTDLSIVLALFTIWQWSDAKDRSLPFWPYALMTAALGAAGPLAYLGHREVRVYLARRDQARDPSEVLA